MLAHPLEPLTATVRAAPPSGAYRASWRGMKTSRTSSSSAAASGIAMRAPRTPSSAPPAITAITATAAGTDTALGRRRRIQFALREDVAARGWHGMADHAAHCAAELGIPEEDALAVAREMYQDTGGAG